MLVYLSSLFIVVPPGGINARLCEGHLWEVSVAEAEFVVSTRLLANFKRKAGGFCSAGD